MNVQDLEFLGKGQGCKVCKHSSVANPFDIRNIDKGYDRTIHEIPKTQVMTKVREDLSDEGINEDFSRAKGKGCISMGQER
jgi:hypothetical protein